MGPRCRLYRIDLRVVVLVAIAGGACSSNSAPPTSPPGVMANYEGQWSGMTSQGMPLAATNIGFGGKTYIAIDGLF